MFDAEQLRRQNGVLLNMDKCLLVRRGAENDGNELFDHSFIIAAAYIYICIMCTSKNVFNMPPWSAICREGECSGDVSGMQRHFLTLGPYLLGADLEIPFFDVLVMH